MRTACRNEHWKPLEQIAARPKTDDISTIASSTLQHVLYFGKQPSGLFPRDAYIWVNAEAKAGKPGKESLVDVALEWQLLLQAR